MTPKAGLLAMLASRIAGVPIRIHTFTGQVWATRGGLTRLILKSADRLLAGSATIVLADSQSQLDFLVTERVVPLAKGMVLGSGSVSGVDVGRFKPDDFARLAVRESLQLSSSDLVLLFVGRLTHEKGVIDLVRAFKVLASERDDIWLVFVGPDEGGRRAIEAVGSRQSSRMRFVKFTSSPERVMAAADVLCLPSYREGFGTVIIEAAAVGIPSVASRIYGVIDAVQEGVTGLLHRPGDVDDLTATLRRVVTDPQLRYRLGEAARERVLAHFSQQRVTAAVMSLYRGLLLTVEPDETRSRVTGT
jgi:glycosyltransferase involved in cell wall biosynthesis